jgi:hypothetical protein
MTTLCDIYTMGSPTTTWPVRKFLRSWFRGWADQRLTETEKAWNFFERVESHDAAVRVKLSQGLTGRWYHFQSESERLMYKTGQRLHMIACPSLVWKSQRDLPFNTPITDVRPQLCASYEPVCGNCEGGCRKITAYV